ncbi:hypothetical protein [Sphingosinicella sp. BN140058]|uniref:hypothetical protein n=1 Tax=Sphingosinicella sp. BN140058 TaxID=1892855 RepID=UPI0010127C23|nr:hypothetical protein [Sphingosinicella sp. BN140058]QAY80479.1 hypothetical protein ETR14_27970 [Sphingosinicella sp. BN140058]
MPLPAYITAPITAQPTDVLTRQIQALGVEIDLTRSGATLTVRNLDVSGDNDDLIRRALRLLTLHADANGLSIDATAYPVQENIVSRYEAAGFLVQMLADEADDDSYTLLRRAARS